MAAAVSLRDAIAEHVHDGDTLALEGFTHLIPHAAAHEIIRQERRNLHLVRMTPDVAYDQLIGQRLRHQVDVLVGWQPGCRLAATLSGRCREPMAATARDRRAQPRGDGHPLRRRCGGSALRHAARLRRHGSAEAHHDDQDRRVSVHRRGAGGRACNQSRCRHHPRSARRPRRQRADLGLARRAERSRARLAALAS